MSDRLRIVVLGMMGRCPFAGQTWLYLNWLASLAALGHDVWYVEDDSVWPYDPQAGAVTDDCGYALRHIDSSLRRIGLDGRWVFRLAGRDGATWGMSESRLARLYSRCDLLLNIVGATDLREESLEAPLRVYVETDPVTSQLRLAHGDEHTRTAFDNHHVIATYGENYGGDDCGVPLGDVRYVTTRQPIALPLWPFSQDASARFWTTIGNYRQLGADVEYAGETYSWSKHHEWEKVLALPALTGRRFELAMMPDEPEDRGRLEGHGWRLVPPIPMSLDVFGAYPDFIRSSRAEFTVAKDQNVRLRSGWFSERDACYLASGKPVVAQDTGFSNVLPTGDGLFAWSTLSEAGAAIEDVEADYARHCRVARALAEEWFDGERVAGDLLEKVAGAARAGTTG
jgi:hypothetical protein